MSLLLFHNNSEMLDKGIVQYFVKKIKTQMNNLHLLAVLRNILHFHIKEESGSWIKSNIWNFLEECRFVCSLHIWLFDMLQLRNKGQQVKEYYRQSINP